jgi:2-hydroxy-6-oxonona-2,4-dienedioate hydrolase
MNTPALTLNDKDPKVIAARQAEKELYEYYGLTAKEYYITIPGQNIRVRVYEIGTGEPLVIVPGNTGDAFPLASLMAQFKDRRIIAINRPGGGLSEGIDHNTVDIHSFAVNTLETVLNAFDLENVDVVAHSMGAHWSLWLAMDRPRLVRSLTLLGNPGNVMQGKPPLLLRLISKPPFNKLFFKLLMPSDRNKALRSLKFMGHSDETISLQPKALGDCYYCFRVLPHYQISAISLMENGAPKIDEPQLKQVTQPTLFILGTKDTFASIETGQSIATALPNCEFHAIPNAGHLPWLESAEECGSLINRFTAGINITYKTTPPP